MQQITTLDSIMNEAFLYFFAERGMSQKTCQDNIVLVLSGNKATKH